MKLVSRRFNDVVKSPHAWINAFGRYFPGPDALRATADTSTSETAVGDLKTEKRSFTRLSAVATWTGEYLLRTKLLRCLNRGRPALPFACPAPGKSNKGYATFTFSSRLRFGISHLNAKFGPVLDKRLPQFVHGLSSVGTVTSSDKRGKFDGWGLNDHIEFSIYTEMYAGTAPWGLGTGEVVVGPNVMDLSATYGMIYGECVPAGSIYYLPSGDKHGRYLSPFIGEASIVNNMPRLSSEDASVCSVWIAKSLSLSKGLVGLLAGSSNGVVSAYSLGSSGERNQQHEKGELTARWILSPGVPIIALAVDEQYNEVRSRQRRVWAVALNALGELFVLRDVPVQSSASAVSDEALAFAKEAQAWRTGRTASWQLIRLSCRQERQPLTSDLSDPEYYTNVVLNGQDTDDIEQELKAMAKWAAKTPAEIKADFDGWDMRRRLVVDFAGDDDKGAGEHILVINCGHQEDQPASLKRYTRCTIYQQSEPRSVGVHVPSTNQSRKQQSSDKQGSIFNTPSATWSFGDSTIVEENYLDRDAPVNTTDSTNTEWRCSEFTCGRLKNLVITSIALDESTFATTTCAEDTAFRAPRANEGSRAKPASQTPLQSDDLSPLRSPGQRSRFIAVGSGNGKILLWNIRAPPSGNSKVISSIAPFRVVHTESPEITSLALSALYLVHGGSEGLVQAWDPLASSLEPVRTISSRNTLNARRRAVIAAQSNPIVQVQMANLSYAATAICLDPDPTVLRGVVAMGNHLRYWSFSSTAATEDLSKSQKRRINRAMRGLNSSSGDAYIGTRRTSLKGIVGQQIAERNFELKEQRAEYKQERRLAGRFGLDLLGDDASEEEMLAYATMLSQEEQESRIREALAAQTKLRPDASEDEVEAYLNNLSEEDRARWRYASWQERYEIPASSEVSTSGIRSSPSVAPADDDLELAEAIRLSLGEPSPAPSSAGTAVTRAAAGQSPSVEDELEKAIRLSLAGDAVPIEAKENVHSTSRTRPVDGPSLNDPVEDGMDDEIAEAIRLSLAESGPPAPSPPQTHAPRRSSPPQHRLNEDDELARAIQLSLQEQGDGTWTRNGSSLAEDDFPALSASSSPGHSNSRRSRGGKGKERSKW